MSFLSLRSSATALATLAVFFALTSAVAEQAADAASTASAVATSGTQAVLRVAADPNNLPFSNDHLQGFENRIAEIIADELGRKVEWVWHAQRRGFIRNTLKANKADVTLGVPAGFEMAKPTKPYYHSTYVFVTRKIDGVKVTSLDDAALRNVTVGVQLIGDDGSNSPPAHALGRRGIVNNVRGFTVYGDYSQPNPPARIVEAVATGDIDVGIVWGPLAGYFAKQSTVPLELTPVTPALDPPALPMAFSIAAGVRRGDDKLFSDVERALQARAPEIQEILQEYGVPLVEAQTVPVFAEEDDDDD